MSDSSRFKAAVVQAGSIVYDTPATLDQWEPASFFRAPPDGA